MARARPCDCCGGQRLKWQRLCASCWRVLPSTIRSPLIAAWKRGDKPEWRRQRKAAREFLTDRAHAHVRACSATTSAEQAYARTAAMLGERE
jgi:hypothetical protein